MSHTRKWLGLLVPLWLLYCNPETREETTVSPPVALADRESWDVHFILREMDLLVEIQAPYMWDQGHFTYADSARIEFRTPAGNLHSSLSATRLTLDGAERVSMGGKVFITGGESLEVSADTLVWERPGKQLHLPGAVRILTPSGLEEGHNLQGDIDLTQWSMEEPSGHWQGRRENRAYEVEIRAQRALSVYQEGYLLVYYDTVTVRHQNTTIHAPKARFDEKAGVVYFSGGVSSVDSMRQFSAQVLDYQLNEKRAVARNAVVLQQADWQLEADYLLEEGRNKFLRASGRPARFRQEALSITADKMDYDEHAASLQASGKVVFRDRDRLLHADHLIYRRNNDHLEVDGGLSLQTPELEGILQSGKMRYDLEAGHIDLAQNPQFRRARPEGTLVIHADSMHIDLGRRQLKGTGEFGLASPEVDLHSARGLYDADEEHLILVSEVVLSQREEGNSHNRIQADSMIVQLRNGAVEKVHIPSPIQGSLQSSPAWISTIQGTESRFFFEGVNLERIDLESDADLIHRRLDEDALDHIRGDSMSLYFAAEQGLQHIRVQGRAEFLSTVPPEKEGQPPSINQLKGEELEIFLESGSIVEAKLIKPEGRYYPPNRSGEE